MTSSTNTGKFEAILDLEAEVRGARASLTFAPSNLSDWAWQGRRDAFLAAQALLFEAIDNLTEDEGRAFGEYRKSHTR